MRLANLLVVQGLIKRTYAAVLGREGFPTVRSGSGLASSMERGQATEAGAVRTWPGRLPTAGVVGTCPRWPAGFRYTRGAFSIEGQVRGLVARESSGYEEWGASGAIRVNPSRSGRGFTFSLVPVWGQAGSRAGNLWDARDARALEPGAEFEAGGQIETELGYGMGVPGSRGVVTPYTGLSFGEGNRSVRAGTRWNLGMGAVMGLEGTRHQGSDGKPGSSAIEFRTEVRW